MLTCNVCGRQFRNAQALQSHLNNPGQSHAGQRRAAPRSIQRPQGQRSQAAPRVPRAPRVPSPLQAPAATSRCSVSVNISQITTSALALHTWKLSGANTATRPPGLPIDARIRKITIEYRGSLAATGKIAWAAVIGSTVPTAAPTRARVLEVGGVGAHDAAAAALAVSLAGTPLNCDLVTERVLILTADLASGGTWSVDLVINIDYLTDASQVGAFPAL